MTEDGGPVAQGETLGSGSELVVTVPSSGPGGPKGKQSETKEMEGNEGVKEIQDKEESLELGKMSADDDSIKDQNQGKYQDVEEKQKEILEEEQSESLDQDGLSKEVIEINQEAVQGGENEGIGLEASSKLAMKEKENEWLDVSPGKSSRSPTLKTKDLKFGQVSILTNSRFSVLSSAEEGEITDTEKEEIEYPVTEEPLKSQEGTKEKEVVVPRQSLPRDSKIKHKVLGDKSVQKAQDACPSELNKKKPRH
ncbi:hypothetical protein YC2023_073248 [Brassica napus]